MIDTPVSSRKYVDVISPVRAGTLAQFAFDDARGKREVQLISRPRERSWADNLTDIFLVLTQILFILIAAALVYFRPSVMTWAFYIYALSTTSKSLILTQALPPWGAQLTDSWALAGDSIGWVGFVVFALRFPTDKVAGWRAALERIVLAIGTVMALICAFVVLGKLGVAAHAAPAGGTVVKLLVDVDVAGFVLGLIVFVISYTQSVDQERQRMGWVLTGFLFGFGGVLTVTVIQRVFSIAPPLWLINGLLSLNIAVPLTVAYAIVRYRVIDVRFFLNRALVYGTITTLAVAALSIGHWFISQRFEGIHIGLGGELAFALFIGLGLQRVHSWVDGLVDRFVFSDVHNAEQHLDDVGNFMLQAQEPVTIDTMLCTESAQALRLCSAAVFHGGTNGAYRRAQSVGWGASNGVAFDPDDSLVLALKAKEKSVSAGDRGGRALLRAKDGEPAGDAAPILAIPFAIRHTLNGFALFGAHTNGAAIDPDERRILEKLVERASFAYDRALAHEQAAELASCATQIAALQAQIDLLRSLAKDRPSG